MVDEIVANNKEGNAYESFQLEIIRIFSVQPNISKEEFINSSLESVTDRVFNQLLSFYHNKATQIAEQTLPVLTNVLEERGSVIENVVIPFSDGNRGIQVATNLRKAVESEGKEVFKSFEKGIVLALIDEAWKEHLREMDDLKQSVQNAVYEQKDPIIIYKMEAFELFKGMLSEMNRDIIGFLFKGQIPGQQQEPENIREATEARPEPKVKATKAELSSPTGVSDEDFDTRERTVTQPIRKEVNVGRNDPCPCGSGLKYKNCHGKS